MASSALAEMGLSVTSRRASPHTPAAATAPSPGPLGFVAKAPVTIPLLKWGLEGYYTPNYPITQTLIHLGAGGRRVSKACAHVGGPVALSHNLQTHTPSLPLTRRTRYASLVAESGRAGGTFAWQCGDSECLPEPGAHPRMLVSLLRGEPAVFPTLSSVGRRRPRTPPRETDRADHRPANP